MIAFGADVTLKDKAGATAERFAVKYGNNEARDVLKERARVLELVAWHRAAVREAAFWVQEAAAADAAVCSSVLISSCASMASRGSITIHRAGAARDGGRGRARARRSV